jgi:mono/diheme cytochrome c family protein
MRYEKVLTAGLGCALLFAAACGGGGGSGSVPLPGAGAEVPASPGVAAETAPSPTFSSIQTNIFAKQCVSCHNPGKLSAGIDLASYAGLQASAVRHGDPVVDPGSPDTSHLYMAVSSGSMPPGGSKLTQARLKAIHDWIQAGAQNN